MDSENVLQDRLYKGTIRLEDLPLHERGVMPGRSNPYKYYELPPDYYDYWRKRRQLTSKEGQVPAPKHTDSRHARKEPTSKKQQEVVHKMDAFPVSGNKEFGKIKSKTKNQIHPQTNKNIEKVNNHKSWCCVDEGRTTAALEYLENNVERHSPERSEHLSQAVSHGNTVYNPLYRQTGGHTFQPLLHVSDPDAVQSLPVVRIKAHEVTGNPLIPVKIPVDYVTDLDPSTYGHDLDYCYESDEGSDGPFTYHTTGIPSYTAVGSVLFGSDL